MKHLSKIILFILFTLCFTSYSRADGVSSIVSAKKVNATTVELLLSDNHSMILDFYGDNIFRIFRDDSGCGLRDPEAKPEAKILVEQPRKDLTKLELTSNNDAVIVETSRVKLTFDKLTALLKVVDLKSQQTVIQEVEPVRFEGNRTFLTLKENPNEYFYGGGVQNGRFSHKGKIIAIENQNSWTDGGVASPTPFYWSTSGYGMMYYSFAKGKYDFGASQKGKVQLMYESNYLDCFFMVDSKVPALLCDYYQLTGNPVLLPKFGFYEGHLNAYNRDYWKENSKGILFEDGKRYSESQKNDGGIHESLNGEKNNYQFSARAVVDRYAKHDMPLGWILPNDGYGAGYGQAETLDGNIQNLKSFGDYARQHGVQIGLWTQSDLHPKAGVSALLQRDIVKEVHDAGVRVLKTDVAWVGEGYSFGLNGVADVAHIMPEYGEKARPFIITVDGWAGTQRYSGVWTGDQTGGEWEYIRFHIPTYIGSGLSGIPNITSDMDGIFGGKNPVVNARDFQWKTFTPMQLNMDGWGSNEKYPQALGEPTTSINRNYLKLKAQLIPYIYSIAKESVDGLPMMRAMFLQTPNDYTYGRSTEYQFLFGPSFLVAPVYRQTKMTDTNTEVRNGIYLPDGYWIDYLTGEGYKGNCILNNFETPIWKLPVFVKAGAIIPMANPNNNVSEINKSLRIYDIYPYQKSSFTEYDDDGTTEDYKAGNGATTLITSAVVGSNLTVTVSPVKGTFNGMVKRKVTEFNINVTSKPQQLTATIGKSTVALAEVKSLAVFNKRQNVFFYEARPNLNKFATPGTEYASFAVTKNPVLHVRLAATDIAMNAVVLKMKGFVFHPADKYRVSSGSLTAPANAQVTAANTEAYTLDATWNKVANADYYEMLFNGMLYTTIKENHLLFEDLTPSTAYSFKVRAVNKGGMSDWSSFNATTKSNPLEFAIHGLKGQLTAKDQEGFEVSHLFDFAESGDVWHTQYRVKAVPFDMVIDLCSTNTIDRFQYLPRTDAGNGTLLKGTVSYSTDKQHWTDAGAFDWKRDGDAKVFSFANHPTVRYIKLSVTEAVGNYGSGRELYVFKVPGTPTIIPGDVNNDGKIDKNDLTSYMNYTGLKKGDPDFDGYISNGDINHNDRIDAYDISVVATQLEDGVEPSSENVGGSVEITTDKQSYAKDEEVDIHVKGVDLHAVNAIGFALPYDQQEYEFIGIQPVGVKAMENMTYDRLHKDGSKVLYPTFVNIGNKDTVDGSNELFVIRLKAKKKVKFNLQITNGELVDKMLSEKPF